VQTGLEGDGTLDGRRGEGDLDWRSRGAVRASWGERHGEVGVQHCIADDIVESEFGGLARRPHEHGEIEERITVNANHVTHGATLAIHEHRQLRASDYGISVERDTGHDQMRRCRRVRLYSDPARSGPA
jgi:hypothetical protein